MTVYYHDLFAGPGGWDVAADGLGWVGVGFELDGPACETRRANGHTTVQGDVSQLSVARVFSADILAALPEWRRALIASPPCPTFSAAPSRRPAAPRWWSLVRAGCGSCRSAASPSSM